MSNGNPRLVARTLIKIRALEPWQVERVYFEVVEQIMQHEDHLWTWLYFIQEGDDGPIKIGVARDPRARLKTMQGCNSNLLTIRGLRWEHPRVEKELHAHFGHLRIRGEWFRPAPELLRIISNSYPEAELEVEMAA